MQSRPKSILLGALLVGASIFATTSCSSAPTVAEKQALSSFQTKSQALVQVWNQQSAEGVSTSSLAPLRHSLQTSPFENAAPNSPLWDGNQSTAFLNDLTQKTNSVWKVALTSAHQKALSLFTSWNQLASEFNQQVPSQFLVAHALWISQLTLATTPVQLNDLSQAWSLQVNATRSAALTNLLAPFGGLDGLLTSAQTVITTANTDSLDSSLVASPLSNLQQLAKTNQDAVPAIYALLGPLSTLRALLGQETSTSSALANLQGEIQRASSAKTPHANGFLTKYQELLVYFHRAKNGPALTSLNSQVASLYSQVLADFPVAKPIQRPSAPAAPSSPAPVGCGLNVPSGKVVIVSLSSQSAVFYDNRCVVNTSLVTTGQPGLRTPTGTFHIFQKVSPIHFTSPWPKGSRYYYAPESASYGMEYEGGGFYLHDAPWEPANGFGPGSQNGPSASHGCVHFPTSVMAWLYGWAPLGTTVIITS